MPPFDAVKFAFVPPLASGTCPLMLPAGRFVSEAPLPEKVVAVRRPASESDIRSTYAAPLLLVAQENFAVGVALLAGIKASRPLKLLFADEVVFHTWLRNVRFGDCCTGTPTVAFV